MRVFGICTPLDSMINAVYKRAPEGGADAVFLRGACYLALSRAYQMLMRFSGAMYI